jgi:hypothetical protein
LVTESTLPLRFSILAVRSSICFLTCAILVVSVGGLYLRRRLGAAVVVDCGGGGISLAGKVRVFVARSTNHRAFGEKKFPDPSL